MDVIGRPPAPDVPRSELVRRLLKAGAQSLVAEGQSEGEKRMAAVDRLRSITKDMYRPGYLEQLRKDWPE